jgi:hypothetical protein
MPQRESDKLRKPYVIRLAPDEQARIASNAEAANLPFSTYMRDCALRKRITQGLSAKQAYLARQQHINELRKLGGLLKHLFTESGGYKGSADPAAFASVLGEMRMAAKRIEKGGE